MTTKKLKDRRLTLDPERTREQRDRFQRAEVTKEAIRRRIPSYTRMADAPPRKTDR